MPEIVELCGPTLCIDDGADIDRNKFSSESHFTHTHIAGKPWRELLAIYTQQCGPYTPTEGQTTRGGRGGTFHAAGTALDVGCANGDCRCAERVFEPMARGTGGASHAGKSVGTGKLCLPGDVLCVPDPTDLPGMLGDALIAFVMALTGGKSLAEVTIRGLEVWGGGVLMLAGLVMILRILKGTSVGGGLARGASPITRSGRRVRRVVRREVARQGARAAEAAA